VRLDGVGLRAQPLLAPDRNGVGRLLCNSYRQIAIAQQQRARSFELRAALSLARLYQSSNRAADAHAALAPALEGFLPTPEFPEIAEAQTLLAALAS
jgi:hypothetical protein